MSTERNIPQKIVYILLAAFNGERFIGEQISSIRSQTYANWKLIIRDDGSTDKTKDIILKHIQSDSRIKLIESDQEQKGCVRNFAVLMAYAKKNHAEYICFSDQDDVWRSEKISILIKQMEALESHFTKTMPMLVYSDLEVVDEQLRLIYTSYMNQQRLSHPEFETLSRLLVENTVTGCAMLINRALLQIASPIPNTIIIHDWWVALCAAMTGKLYFVDKPLIKYRQHQNNTIGLTSYSQIFNPRRFLVLNKLIGSHRNFCNTFQQARELLNRTGDISSLERAQYVKDFSELELVPLKQRIATYKDLKLSRSNRITNLLLLLHIIILRRKR
ncbi:glycosyltransferase family 2 protein [Methylophaga thalassica]|uniref:glycosyltransferase family 2 protein n=1 Tax=Methylophaga aminisulfidivorans TaxID=230105 RepID=UPI0024E1A2B1|nr:glycosyltransferase family 2 protein [Methylophaga aminisulfidivorans]